ncbi:hypothetical protein PHLCEN_2v13636 [Hermanssonia centrifuga]|uniref:Uncharacterized protein n=1 Tax=Hermanssonia centrifuga TaxID=98765 RepID=A0A2R6NDQ4_9APHY|nr:hypothetical protein PHLCEN_2v13636 [Hermanssonia centrifuga]
MSYFARGDEEEDVGLVDDAEGIDELEDVDMSDARTPLDKTIDRIGMGMFSQIPHSCVGLSTRTSACRELPVDPPFAMRIW